MTYKLNMKIPAAELADLRQSVGWNRMEKAYKSELYTSFCHICAYDGERLVGFIDCVSNGVTDAYIQDLLVHPDYQRKGIGTELMNRMIRFLKEKRIFMISVIYEEKLSSFYKRFGFFEMRSGQMQTYDCE